MLQHEVDPKAAIAAFRDRREVALAHGPDQHGTALKDLGTGMAVTTPVAMERN
jgi:hypothetical protein